LTVEPGAIKVAVAFDVPSGPHAQGTQPLGARQLVPRAPETALTPAQLQLWQARLDDWDGFLSFVVKDLAGENVDPTMRDDLLSLLLDARREAVDILARGPEPGADAVRRLFLSVWSRLRDIVRRTADQPRDDVTRTFRYFVFLGAGDAIAAIDAVAPT